MLKTSIKLFDHFLKMKMFSKKKSTKKNSNLGIKFCIQVGQGERADYQDTTGIPALLNCYITHTVVVHSTGVFYQTVAHTASTGGNG